MLFFSPRQAVAAGQVSLDLRMVCIVCSRLLLLSVALFLSASFLSASVVERNSEGLILLLPLLMYYKQCNSLFCLMKVKKWLELLSRIKTWCYCGKADKRKMALALVTHSIFLFPKINLQCLDNISQQPKCIAKLCSPFPLVGIVWQILFSQKSFFFVYEQWAMGSITYYCNLWDMSQSNPEFTLDNSLQITVSILCTIYMKMVISKQKWVGIDMY